MRNNIYTSGHGMGMGTIFLWGPLGTGEKLCGTGEDGCNF